MTSENATRDRSQGTFWRKSAKSNPKGQFFFFEQVVDVNGRTCTSCKEAYMGAFKTAWALGFVPQRGITYSIET